MSEVQTHLEVASTASQFNRKPATNQGNTLEVFFLERNDAEPMPALTFQSHVYDWAVYLTELGCRRFLSTKSRENI